MTVKSNYINPVDRVAWACVVATQAWLPKIRTSEAARPRAVMYEHAHLDRQVVLRLIRQVARQGLTPTDCDGADGAAALAAIADAIFSGRTSPAFHAALSPEWKHVYAAAERMLSQDVSTR